MFKILLFVIILFLFLLLLHFLNNESFIYNNENFSYDNEKYTAIIIEPRQHKALELVLTNFISNLDNRWNFIIFHGIDNKEYIKNIISKNSIDNNRIKMINLDIHNLSIYDYNQLFYNKSFYDNIPTEMFLVFQTDTLICKKHKDLIYKFMNYDYVGAPWNVQHWNQNTCTNRVGNGGLSLRRKSKMLELLDNCDHNNQNEDFFFSKLICNCKYDIKVNKPTDEEAKEFAIEHLINDKTFGIHKPWLYINEDIPCCEDYNKLIELNKK